MRWDSLTYFNGNLHDICPWQHCILWEHLEEEISPHPKPRNWWICLGLCQPRSSYFAHYPHQGSPWIIATSAGNLLIILEMFELEREVITTADINTTGMRISIANGVLYSDLTMEGSEKKTSPYHICWQWLRRGRYKGIQPLCEREVSSHPRSQWKLDCCSFEATVFLHGHCSLQLTFFWSDTLHSTAFSFILGSLPQLHLHAFMANSGSFTNW